MKQFFIVKQKIIVNVCMLLLAAINGIVWLEVFSNDQRPDIAVSFFDVGQGDASFIQSRDGVQILIDGGPDGKILSELKMKMPYYDRSIDVVIATHPHKDHIAGLLDVFKRYQIDTFIESGTLYNTAEFYELERLIQQKNIRRVVLRQPAQISFYNDAVLRFLMPDTSFASTTLKNVHDADIVSEFYFEGRKILFMGDAEKNIEKYLIAKKAIGPVDVLKVGHHGSKTSSIGQFLTVTRPKYAVISVGRNRYGHPHQTTLDNLFRTGAKILRTDIAGTVDVNINQGALRLLVRTEK